MKKINLFLFVVLIAVISCTKESTTPSPESSNMVDLGLSVKWASFNLGATKPEEFGTYFAWGDVVGQTWDGTKWSGGGFSVRYGMEDDYGYLKAEYDAAHVILGGKWRMPTYEEFSELIWNCTCTWTSNYNGTGVAGGIYTSKIPGYTDKSIFLPAAGIESGGGDLYEVGSEGWYWSSSASYNNMAWAHGVDSWIESHLNIFKKTIRCGMTIRPVSDY